MVFRRVVFNGDAFFINKTRNGIVHLIIEVDEWKRWLHDRFRVEVGQPRSVSLYSVDPDNPRVNHKPFAEQICAEREDLHINPDGTAVIKWKTIRRQNHWLDSTGYATTAAGTLGMSRLDLSRVSHEPTGTN